MPHLLCVVKQGSWSLLSSLPAQPGTGHCSAAPWKITEGQGWGQLPQDGVEAALRRLCGSAETTFSWDQNPQHAELREGRDGDTGVQEWVAASVPEDRAARFGTA